MYNTVINEKSDISYLLVIYPQLLTAFRIQICDVATNGGSITHLATIVIDLRFGTVTIWASTSAIAIASSDLIDNDDYFLIQKNLIIAT